jgi:tyrosyl-tRNA synthetase
MLKAGIKFKLYLADYFAFLNNKLCGDLEKIRKAGQYFVEVWRACGIDTKKVEIIWAKDLMDGLKYWDRMMRVSKETTFNRAKRAVTIMGRQEGEKLSMGQYMYPEMQVADIFEMDIDICQLGMDQRRAHVLAREIADKYKWRKPVAIHHHILLGLQGMQKRRTKEETIAASKMSKSQPKTCIYMHETPDELKRKIAGAFCPPKIVEGNPLLEYMRYIIFKGKKVIVIRREKKYGGDVEVGSYLELEQMYVKGELHPQDLKNAVVVELDELIAPVREYFEKNEEARKLFEVVKTFKITR